MYKKILVLGSNSFTGSHFIDYVLKNTDSEIIGLSRSQQYNNVFLSYSYNKKTSSKFTFSQLDLNNDLEKICSICDDFEPSLIVNYAAQGEVRNSWTWPEQWYKTNCLSVVNFAEHLKNKEYLKKYIAISTPEVYGATALNISENQCYSPSTPYAVSKLAGELHLLALHKRYGFPVVLTRAANLYGVHQQLYRIIPRTIIYLKFGKKIDLHGKGETLRSFIHARDVAKYTYLAALKGKAGTSYHLGPDNGLIKIIDVVKLICKLMGYDFQKHVNLVDENFGQDSMYSLDNSKSKQDLGQFEFVNFQEGVKETIDWIEDNWDFIKTQPWDYIHKK